MGRQTPGVVAGCDRQGGKLRRDRAAARNSRHHRNRHAAPQAFRDRRDCDGARTLSRYAHSRRHQDRGRRRPRSRDGAGRGRAAHDGPLLDLVCDPCGGRPDRGALRRACCRRHHHRVRQARTLARGRQAFRRASPMSAFILRPTCESLAIGRRRTSTRFRIYAAEASASRLPADWGRRPSTQCLRSSLRS